MDGQAGKGRDFCTQRLDFQSLGGSQGDQAKEGNAYRDLGNIFFYWVTFKKPLSIMKNT